jgi:hypothetical protein
VLVASIGTADALASYLGTYPSKIEDTDLDESDGLSVQGKEHPGKSKAQADVNRIKSRAN